MKHLF